MLWHHFVSHEFRLFENGVLVVRVPRDPRAVLDKPKHHLSLQFGNRPENDASVGEKEYLPTRPAPIVTYFPVSVNSCFGTNACFVQLFVDGQHVINALELII